MKVILPESMESLSASSLTETQKEDFLNQIKQQIAVANIQELINKMVEKCFKKCISKPGITLDGSEQKCVAMCMDRFLESYSLVTKTYSNRIQRESQKM